MAGGSVQQRFNLFLNKANELHNYKFDYSKTNFVDQHTKITIICPEHGEFTQSPDLHIRKNAKGCTKCWNIIKTQLIRARPPSLYPTREIISLEELVVRSIKKFGPKYKYDFKDYNGITGNPIVVICPKHGEFSAIPIAHLWSTTGCCKCGWEKRSKSKTSSYDEVIAECNKIHNNQYTYPEHNREVYVDKKTKIEVICNKHGSFRLSAQKHTGGQECSRCRMDKLVRSGIVAGGYSEEFFVKNPHQKTVPGHLYYASVNDGEYYKIGITKRPLKTRTDCIISKAKNKGKTIITPEVLQTWQNDLYQCFKMEQQILQEYERHRVLLPWSTELFDRDVLEITE